MWFGDISGPSDPEEFSWKVNLSSEQELVAVDDQTAVVYFSPDGTAMGTIKAEAAHDATGAAVPTSLVVSGRDVITLVVHVHDGNPAAGGAPFTYPVIPGPGYIVGASTVTVIQSPADLRLFEKCTVPKLKGLTLKGSRKRLREAGCEHGAVRKATAVTARNGRIVRQIPRPGVVIPTGVGVDVRLGPAR